ncbi:MAG: hypothetical protein WCT77_08465 [Bacteroidota bacterium]|jgi:hypothetical protein
MKKYYKYYLILVAVIAPVFISGCYTDTIDNLSEFTLQVPITVPMFQRGNSDTTFSNENLNKYAEYTNNKERVKRLHLYQSSFWLDSIAPFNSSEVFQKIEYYFIIDSVQYLIARFNNLSVSSFFKIPQIYQVPDDIAEQVSAALLQNEVFRTMLVTTRTPGNNTNYSLIQSSLVMSLRMDVKL